MLAAARTLLALLHVPSHSGKDDTTLMAESEEQLKSLLMKVRVEYENLA